jgi:hypothetical protein
VYIKALHLQVLDRVPSARHCSSVVAKEVNCSVLTMSYVEDGMSAARTDDASSAGKPVRRS